MEKASQRTHTRFSFRNIFDIAGIGDFPEKVNRLIHKAGLPVLKNSESVLKRALEELLLTHILLTDKYQKMGLVEQEFDFFDYLLPNSLECRESILENPENEAKIQGVLDVIRAGTDKIYGEFSRKTPISRLADRALFPSF
jgi:hypothetical protein